MGKLYDRRDLEHDMGVIDTLEQENSKHILAGTFPGFKAKAATDLFDAERQRCKMQLLRTSQLVSDLRGALAVFRGCPACKTDPAGKQRPCKAHAMLLYRAKRACHFAAQDNLGRRLAAGTQRDSEDAPHDGSLNEWETWYFADKRMGVWPGSNPQWASAQYGGLDYRAWLRMLLEEEEIPYPVYLAELQRLRGAER